MIELGRKQILYVDHKTDFGVYLCELRNIGKKDGECILLPRKYVSTRFTKPFNTSCVSIIVNHPPKHCCQDYQILYKIVYKIIR